MGKVRFIALLTGIMSSLPFVANAAYPVYNPQQLARQGYVVNPQYVNNGMPVRATTQFNRQRTNIMPNQLAAASAVNGRPMMNIAATNPNRITGALPRVGSSARSVRRRASRRRSSCRFWGRTARLRTSTTRT